MYKSAQLRFLPYEGAAIGRLCIVVHVNAGLAGGLVVCSFNWQALVQPDELLAFANF
jgi:hypothetical protein